MKTKEETEEKKVEENENEEEKDLNQQIEEVFEKGAEAYSNNIESENNSEEDDKEEEKEEEEEEEKEAQEEEKKEEEEVKEEEEEEEKEEKESKEEEKEEKEKEKEEEVSERERKLLEEAGLKKFKDIKSVIEAYKNLESAYGRAQSLLNSYRKGSIPQEVKEGIEGVLNIVSKPRVSFEPPNPQDYFDGQNFDIASYLKDSLDQYTVNLQKSLVVGSLASALFTVQKAALMDKYSSLKEQEEVDRLSTETARELQELFPDFDKNERKLNLFKRAVAGERELKGEPLTKEEVLKIASEIFEGEKKEEIKEKPIEKQCVSASLSENVSRRKKEGVEAVVDEIFDEEAKRKGIVF